MIDDFPTVLRGKYDTILNHTDLYEYKHGKILIETKMPGNSGFFGPNAGIV